MTTPTSTISDRIKLPLNFDVDKMMEEIKLLKFQNFTYYDAVPLRAPAHMIDPSRPVPIPQGDDFADGSWTDWLDSKMLSSSPYLLDVVDTFRQHTKVNLVRLLRMEAGSEVREHTDPTLGLEEHKSVIRLTVPIYTNDQVQFFLNDKEVPMQPGECWYLRLTDRHRVINAGPTERINMTIDMIPNDWVREMILKSEG